MSVWLACGPFDPCDVEWHVLIGQSGFALDWECVSLLHKVCFFINIPAYNYSPTLVEIVSNKPLPLDWCSSFIYLCRTWWSKIGTKCHHNTPTFSLCSSSNEGERTKVEHDIQRYEASIRDIVTHILFLWSVYIILSWVVEAWNSLESNQFYSSCQLAWDFSIIFKTILA